MAVEKALLRNFQKHERLEVKFDSGITCIVGASDKGKSSLLRALRWVLLNRPRGSMVRRGQGFCRVWAKVDDKVICRERANGKNIYKLGSKAFHSFRDEVPSEIRNLVNVEEFNFTLQHEPPFWLSLSPPELSRQLNKLVDLDVIDTVMGRLEARRRRLRAEEEVTGERLLDAKRRRHDTSFALEADKELRLLEERRQAILVANDKWIGLKGLVDQLCAAVARIKHRRALLNRIEALTSLGASLVELVVKYEGLEDIINGVRTLRNKASRRIPDFRVLESIVSTWSNLVARRDAMRELVSGIRKAVEDLSCLKSELTKTTNRLVQETQGLCPICGREWKAG